MRRESTQALRYTCERDLVEAMRRGEPRGFADFFSVFRPLLLDQARLLRVQPALRMELVDECLGDVALHLCRYTTAVPRSLAPYLVRAFQRRRLLLRRGERRREKLVDAQSAEHAAAGDAVGSISESTMRASAGPDEHASSTSAALERLASMVEEGLTPEEEVLISWTSRFVTQSLIAEWLGISHGAARNRIMRLRARLKETAIRHAATFTGRERVELEQFFRRTLSPAARERTIPASRVASQGDAHET